jgi:hypothetical protein
MGLTFYIHAFTKANKRSTIALEINFIYLGNKEKDVDGRIIVRWIFRKWEGVVGTGWSWLRIGTGGGHLWVR